MLLVTYSDKVVGEQTPASAQLALPPSSIVLPYVHDYVAHRQTQFIVLLGLVVELHHSLHCKRNKGQKEKHGAVKRGVCQWLMCPCCVKKERTTANQTQDEQRRPEVNFLPPPTINPTYTLHIRKSSGNGYYWLLQEEEQTNSFRQSELDL